MDKGPCPNSLDDLSSRLREAQSRARPPEAEAEGGMAENPTRGLGLALRIASELVASLIVGLGLGYGLDVWMGTTPVFFIVFFFLSIAAGGMSVYRVVSGLDMTTGYRKQKSPGGEEN